MEDYEEQDKGESLILSIGDDGKAELHKPEDFIEMKKEEAELVKGFIDENKELFEKYVRANSSSNEKVRK